MTLSHTLNPTILREYDIRGVIDESLTEEDCYFVGRAFGTALMRKNYKTVAIGYDGRESSPRFVREVIRGLVDCGMNVENAGLGPSPMVYFAMKSRNLDAAVVVTGSHSPKQYNGIKMALKTGPFYADDVQSIGRIIGAGDFAEGQGSVVNIDVQDAYVERMAKDYTGPRDLTVAWDCGHGAAGEIIRRLIKKLPGKHILLFDKIDGTFPNHHPDPTVAKNLVDLQKVVIEHKCDLGVAFDGDADRFGAVNEKAEILWADVIMAVYAAEVLKTHPGSTIVADVKSSCVLFDEIKRLGGVPLMAQTGHSVIKAKMIEVKSPFGGELAGHICFGDHYYGFDDGPYCAVRLLNLVSHAGKSLSALTAHLPIMYNTPETRFPVPAERKFQIPKEIIARLRNANNNALSINDIDGVRVTSDLGWWLIRASNTEDVLTVRAEGYSPDGLKTMKAHLVEQLSLSGVASPF